MAKGPGGVKSESEIKVVMKKNELVDTHSHLYLEEFENDLPELMLRAEMEGVSRIYMPSLNDHHFNDMQLVENKYPDRCFSMIGLHPCYVKENYRRELDIIRSRLATRRFAAVGEIGLDYYWSRDFDKYQKISYLEQVRMAKDYQLPIVIHSRNSMDDCVEVLRQEKGNDLRGIFHCFSGTLENAMDIIDCGFMLGIGGVITYKNAGLAEVVAQLPLEKMVLETDAPYLTPVPFRGKRNESSYLKYIVSKIAQLKNVSEEKVAMITTANANMVFNPESASARFL